jgi:hypothetical protein
LWDPAEKRIKVIWGLLSPDNLNGNKPNYILDEFKKWMIDNGYDINRKPDFYELFTKRLCGLEFDTIEKCYSYFKFLVDSYKMQNKVKLEKLK